MTTKAPVKMFEAWSFSRYMDYQKCPAFANWRHLQKLKTVEMRNREIAEASGKLPETPMQRGARVAGEADRYLTKKTSKVPIELMPLAKTYREIRSLGNLSVEQGWGFTKDWKPCSPTDWKNCWLRVKIDVCYIEEGKAGDVLHIKDNKTGKFSQYKNEEYAEQLDLYGTAGLTLMPSVTKVTAQLLYSDLGIVHPSQPAVYLVGDLQKMQKAWDKRVRPMMNDKRFAPRPNRGCEWCEFSKAKGGPCRF